MSIENKKPRLTPRGERLKATYDRAKESVRDNARDGALIIGGLATAAALGTMIGQHTSPEMHGEQTVVVNTGDTLDGLVNEHVDGGASHTGTVGAEVKNDPDNADVFENGQLDPGEELELPEKVTN